MPSTGPAHLAVIFYAASTNSGATVTKLTHIGAVVRPSGQKASTYDRLLKIEELFPVTPTPIETTDLREFLPAGEIDRLLAARNDVQLVSEEVTTALVTAISQLRPTMSPVIDWLRALEGFSGLGFSETELLWREQRDAANVGLRIGGFSPTPLRAWRRPAEGEPFIAGVVPYPRPNGEAGRQTPTEAPSQPAARIREDERSPAPDEGNDQSHDRNDRPQDEESQPVLSGLVPKATEARLIEHDARTFPGWRHMPNRQVHIHTFTDGDRRMEIVNVDASGVEAKTGADLIYYHVNTKSFVLVQYKRLHRRTLSIDDRLRDQLARMDDLAKLNQQPSQPDDWRIGPDFGFLKLADTMAHETPADRLIRGLYLPSSYVGILLAQNRTRLGYDTVDRHLSNKQFIEFVAHGLVGTVGITVEQLQEIVNGLADAGDSVVVAEDHSDESTAERQRRLRSRSAR
ncbi:hypothetical protein Phou_091150 [Phytohabitans houttuyneae]|uniref:Uncharacterized protein n=2 Tax=Phytohabitans houttuyneae TaxID=1076126 RepID=A0A6V8KWH4_9ACTN|nr:hypothetical protein Phou_091150 [Phytohabitans houttuyneae]